MEMKYGGAESKQFVTNLGLITSSGKWGHNIMTAEWVHHISYDPAMVVVNIDACGRHCGKHNRVGQFGISLASEDQGELIKVAGNSTGKEVDKIAVLRELGFGFYKAKMIDVNMVDGAVLNLECKLIKHEKMGDHIMFVGEVLKADAHTDKNPVIFKSGTGLFQVGDKLAHEDKSKEIEKVVKRHAKGKNSVKGSA